MGWITLSNGETVHTQVLNQNPIVEIETMETKTTGGTIYITQNYVYEDGTKQTVTLNWKPYLC